MSYKTKIEDLIGAVGDDDLISDALIMAGTKIIDITPIDKLKSSAKSVSVTSSGLDVSDKKVLEVSKGGYSARFLPESKNASSIDSGSIHYALTTDPIFYYKDEKVFIAVDGALTSGTCLLVPKIPTTDGSAAVAHGSSAVVNFPREAESLLILGSSITCLQRIISDRLATLKAYIQTDEDPELAQVETLEIQGNQTLLATIKADYDQTMQIYAGTTN